MKLRRALPALCLLLALNGCIWGDSPEVDGGGTEVEGLTGAVTDAQGARLANARILVFPEATSGLGKATAGYAAIRDSARSDAQGEFRVDSLPAGSYALWARIVRNDTTLTVLVRDILHDGGTRDLGLLTLMPGGSLSVKVSSNGNAVAGARCGIIGLEEFTGTSAADGKCLLTGLPQGRFRVTITHPTLGSGETGTLQVTSGTTTDGGGIVLEGAPVDTAAGSRETTVYTEADTYVNRSSTGEGVHLGNNFGAEVGILVGVFDLYTIPTGLFRFNLPADLASARITKAVLRVNSYAWQSKNVHPSTVTVNLHKILRNWKEGTGVGSPNSAAVDGVTARERFWGAQDGTEDWNMLSIGFNDVDASAVSYASATRPGLYNGVWEFDVTALAKAWADAPAQNFGALLKVNVPATNELVEDYPAFYSRESAVADSLKPRLVLTLTAP